MRKKLISSILPCLDFSIFCNRWIFSKSQPQFSFKFIRFNSLPHSRSLMIHKVEERINMKKLELNKQWASQDCFIQASPNHGANSRAANPGASLLWGSYGLSFWLRKTKRKMNPSESETLSLWCLKDLVFDRTALKIKTDTLSSYRLFNTPHYYLQCTSVSQSSVILERGEIFFSILCCILDATACCSSSLYRAWKSSALFYTSPSPFLPITLPDLPAALRWPTCKLVSKNVPWCAWLYKQGISKLKGWH